MPAQVQTVAGVRTVGGAVTLYGNSDQVPSDPHGIFLVNAATHSSAAEWTPYILPLIGGCLGTGANQNPCSPLGNSIKGGSHEANWGTISTSAPPGVSAGCGTSCTGGVPSSYDDGGITTRVVDWDTCNGTTNCKTPPHKQSGLEIETTKYQDSGAGTFNPGLPSWYTVRVPLTSIARTSQGGYGVINISTGATNITFLAGTLVGTNPAGGCIPVGGASLWGGVASDGVTQCVQLLGNAPADLNGVYAICDSRTTGCSNPTGNSLSLYTSTTTVETGTTLGTAGNPIMDYDNSALGLANDVCTNAGIPVYWGQNFWNGYRAFLSHEFTTWGSDSRIAYLRPGFGHGYENYPATQNGPSGNCRAVLQSFGYPTTEPANCVAGGGCAFWVSMLNAQMQWIKSNVASLTTKPIEFALNLTSYAHPDPMAPTLEANNATAAGLTLDSNGLQQYADLSYVYPGTGCDNNSCYNFDAHRGNISYNWQTVGLSDPSGTLNTTVCAGDSLCNQAWQTGPIPPLLRFAIFHGVQRIELYSRDAECAIPGFAGSNFGGDSKIPTDYAHCFAAGYAESLRAAAAVLQ